MIGAKDQELVTKDQQKEEQKKKEQEEQQQEQSTNGEQAQVSQLLSLLKQYNENTQQLKEVQNPSVSTPAPLLSHKPTPPYVQQAQEEKAYVDAIRMKKQKEEPKAPKGDKDEKKDGDEESKQKTVFEKYWEITVPKNYIEEMTKNNTKAAAAYTENSQGRDPLDNMSLFEGEVDMKVNRKEVSDEFEMDGVMPFFVRINEHSIYYSSNKTSGYRGLLGSLEFEEIITPDDYTLIGKCCQNVFTIEQEQMKGEVQFCFKIDTV